MTNTQSEDIDSPIPRDPAADQDAISFQLQIARVEAGLSVVELSKMTGISKTVLHGYERGRTKPGAREIRLLCSALAVSPNKLILGSEDFHSETPELTSFYRKLRARPAMAGVYFTMLMPAISLVLDEDEVKSLLNLVAALVKARSPQLAEELKATALQAMQTLNEITMPDGAVKVSEDELMARIKEAQKESAMLKDN